MTDDGPDPAGQTTVTLLSGLLDDCRTLIRQEYQLFKDEISTELSELRATVVAFALGLILMSVSALLLLLMTVHLLHEVVGLPLWLSYGILAVPALIGGLLFIKTGSATAHSFTPFPTRTIRSIKEDAQWIKQHVRWSKT
jgi:hypothetical protein